MRNFTTEQLTAMRTLARQFGNHELTIGEYHVRLTQFYAE